MDVVKTKCLGKCLLQKIPFSLSKSLGNRPVPRRILKHDYGKIISDAQSSLGNVIVGRRGNWSVNNNQWGRRFAEKARIMGGGGRGVGGGGVMTGNGWWKFEKFAIVIPLQLS